MDYTSIVRVQYGLSSNNPKQPPLNGAVVQLGFFVSNYQSRRRTKNNPLLPSTVLIKPMAPAPDLAVTGTADTPATRGPLVVLPAT
jgi:hypothetical protein